MTAAWAWLMSRAWAQWVVGLGLAVLAFMALMLHMRKTGEAIGRAAEASEQRGRVKDAERDMARVPRPTPADVDDRLRHGTF